MFFKIDKFGVARPIFCSFALKILDDSLNTSSTSISDECAMYPEMSTSQPPCYAGEFTYSDGFTDFTNEWRWSEVTEISESSINAKRAAINIMLRRDIFGYGEKRNARRNSSRKFREVPKNTERLNKLYVSSSDSSPIYRGGTLNFSSFDFISDSSADSLLEMKQNSSNVNGILDSVANEGGESGRKNEESDDTLDLSVINAEFQRRFRTSPQIIEKPHEEMYLSNKHQMLALNGKSNESKQYIPFRRNSPGNWSHEKSRKIPFEETIIYGVRSDVKEPILTVHDFEQPRRLSDRKITENNDTSIVPFRSGENDEDIDFMAEVQLIIQEFQKRMERLP